MASNYLTHCSHQHQLVKTQGSSQQFICDVCTYKGNGDRYRCNACDFDLHDHCAELPETLSFFAHPGHNLYLAPEKSNPQACDICYELIHGFSYRCIGCDFDVHLHCTTLQYNVRSPMHPEHSLSLTAGIFTCSSDACRDLKAPWFYKCGTCKVISFHVNCLHGEINPMADAQRVRSHHANSNSSHHANSNSNDNKSDHGRGRRSFMTQAAAGTAANLISNLFLNN